LISGSFAFRLISLPLVASLVFGCGGPLSLDEAGLLDAVAFVIGGQQEGAIPQGFETRWRRTVHEREIKYQSIGPYAGFDQANDPHRDSRRVTMPVVPFVGARSRASRREVLDGLKNPPTVGACVNVIRPSRCNAPASLADMVVDDDHIPLRTTVRDLSPAPLHEGRR
jgi:hypothetical protein